MSADLIAQIPMLQSRIDELSRLLPILGSWTGRVEDLGQRLTSKADAAVWQCAKADQYRAAQRARRDELMRVQQLLIDLVTWVGELMQRDAEALDLALVEIADLS